MAFRNPSLGGNRLSAQRVPQDRFRPPIAPICYDAYDAVDPFQCPHQISSWASLDHQSTT